MHTYYTLSRSPEHPAASRLHIAAEGLSFICTCLEQVGPQLNVLSLLLLQQHLLTPAAKQWKEVGSTVPQSTNAAALQNPCRKQHVRLKNDRRSSSKPHYASLSNAPAIGGELLAVLAQTCMHAAFACGSDTVTQTHSAHNSCLANLHHDRPLHQVNCRGERNILCGMLTKWQAAR